MSKRTSGFCLWELSFVEKPQPRHSHSQATFFNSKNVRSTKPKISGILGFWLLWSEMGWPGPSGSWVKKKFLASCKVRFPVCCYSGEYLCRGWMGHVGGGRNCWQKHPHSLLVHVALGIWESNTYYFREVKFRETYHFISQILMHFVYSWFMIHESVCNRGSDRWPLPTFSHNFFLLSTFTAKKPPWRPVLIQ